MEMEYLKKLGSIYGEIYDELIKTTRNSEHALALTIALIRANAPK